MSKVREEIVSHVEEEVIKTCREHSMTIGEFSILLLKLNGKMAVRSAEVQKEKEMFLF